MIYGSSLDPSWLAVSVNSLDAGAYLQRSGNKGELTPQESKYNVNHRTSLLHSADKYTKSLSPVARATYYAQYSSLNYCSGYTGKLREVTILELQDLYREHGQNARLVLQALCRKLRFLREDRCLPFGASTSSATPIAELAYIQSLKDDEDVLNHITRCYFEVDRRRHAIFEDEFYVGYWDAWCDIRDIGINRKPYQRYMDSIAVIERARLDLYFPHRQNSISILRGSHDINPFQSPSCHQSSFQSSLHQSELYHHDGLQPSEELLFRRSASFAAHTSQHRCVARPKLSFSLSSIKGLGPGDLRRLDGLQANQGHARYMPALRLSSSPNENTDVPLYESLSLSRHSIVSGLCSKNSSDSMDFACRGLDASIRTSTRQPYNLGRSVAELANTYNQLGRPEMQSSPLKRSIYQCQNSTSVNDTCENIIAGYGQDFRQARSVEPKIDRPFGWQSIDVTYDQIKTGMPKSTQGLVSLGNDNFTRRPRKERLNARCMELLSSDIFDPVDLSVMPSGRQGKASYWPSGTLADNPLPMTDLRASEKSIESGQSVLNLKTKHTRFVLD